jgi:hypothetical protein
VAGNEPIAGSVIQIYGEGSSLKIESDVEMSSIVVYSLFGQVMSVLYPRTCEARIANLPKGVVFVKIKTSKGEVVKKAINSSAV